MKTEKEGCSSALSRFCAFAVSRFCDFAFPNSKICSATPTQKMDFGEVWNYKLKLRKILYG